MSEMTSAAERARTAAWQRWKMGDVQSPQARDAVRSPDAGLYGSDGSPPLKVHTPLAPRQASPSSMSSLSSAQSSQALQPLQPLQPSLLMDETELVRLRQVAQAAGHAEGWREGIKEGRALGEQQGREVGLNETRQAAAQWAVLTQSLPRALADADAAMAEQVVSLAMALARQVLGQSLALQPEAVLTAVREVLNTEPALTGQPQLWLHPDDVVLVKEHLSEELQASGWRVRADAQMARGGCRVQAVSGEIDATLPTRWAKLASLLSPGAEAKS